MLLWHRRISSLLHQIKADLWPLVLQEWEWFVSVMYELQINSINYSFYWRLALHYRPDSWMRECLQFLFRTGTSQIKWYCKLALTSSGVLLFIPVSWHFHGFCEFKHFFSKKKVLCLCKFAASLYIFDDAIKSCLSDWRCVTVDTKIVFCHFVYDSGLLLLILMIIYKTVRNIFENQLQRCFKTI